MTDLLATMLLRSSRPISKSLTGGWLRPLRVSTKTLHRDIPPVSFTFTRYIASSHSRPTLSRSYSSSPALADPPDHLDENERQIYRQLRDALDPVALQVQDISGGCGTMFAVDITSDCFKGLPVIKQHRLVNQVLGDQIKTWHGIQLKTSVP